MKTLRELPPEVVSKRGGPVRSALAKAARMMQKATQANLQAIIDQPNEGEEVSKSTGLLKKNIVAKRGRLAGGEKGEMYSVRVQRKSYPDSRGRRVTTPQVARLLEYGTEKRQAHPFIRPAFDANKAQAVKIFVDEINKKLAGIVKKLAVKNRAT